MSTVLTLDQILNISSAITSSAKKFEDETQMLSLKMCSKYSTSELRTNINSLFSRFKNVKYFYNFSVEESTRITPIYELRDGMMQRSNISQSERIVTKEIDEKIWATKFYNTIILVSQKLTKSEAEYLIGAFIKNKSQESIAEAMGMSPRGIEHIKKSCFIKVWAELEPLSYEEI